MKTKTKILNPELLRKLDA